MKSCERFIIRAVVFGLALAFLASEIFKIPENEASIPVALTAQDRLEIQYTRSTESQRVHDVGSAETREHSNQKSEPKKSLSDQENRDVAESLLFPVYGYHWGREAIPELRDFSKWADEYTKSPRRSKEFVREGVERAKVRREMMHTLIQMDPEVALASAIPRDVRVQLPAMVLNHSERYVAGIGDLEVAVVTPEDRVRGLGPLVQRSARLPDGTYQAHVYGQMKGFGTVDGLYLHGVVVEDQLALADTPMRPLEVGESLVPGKTVKADHPVSLSLANRVREDGIGPFFAEDKEGYKCLCCGAPEWDNYGAYLGAAVGRGGPPVAGAIGRAYSNTGARKLLLIPVEFSDKTGSPWSTTAVRDSRISDIKSYFSSTSYGIFTLPTVDTVPLQLMDNNSTHYEDSSAGRDLLRNHAVAKATTAGYNSDDYDFVAIVLNHNWMSGYAGYGQVGAKFSWIDGSSSGSELDQVSALYIHELGHNLGLWHANAWNPATSTPDDTSGTHVEYGHDFDVMGDTWTYSYDKLHVNASFKNAMDWLPDSAITTVSSDTTVDLYVMDQTQVSGRTYAIKIPAGISLGSSSNLDYWVEFRSRFPSRSTLDDGVLIFMNNDTHADEALKLLDMNPSTSSVSDAGLDKGQSFTISSSRWKITVNSQTGSGASSLVNVSIVELPTITSHPSDVTTDLGTDVTFTVVATGSGLSYQWFKDGTSIAGETNSTLTISSFSESDKGFYHVAVSNSNGTATSNTATLSVTPPSITSHPSDVTTDLGTDVTFTVVATGSGLSYQWFKDGTSIVGETNSTLTISSFSESDKGSYHVAVSNSGGTATSNTASLSVTSSGGGGGCGSVPPLTIFMLGWVTLGFNRLCLLVNFGIRREQGRGCRKVKRQKTRRKRSVPPSATKEESSE
jgi:hypothetical protein